MKKRILVGLGVIFGLLLLVYLGFVIFFSSHYLFNTTVGSIKCGGKSPEYVIEANSNIAKDYLLTIFDRNNNKYHLMGIDFDYAYVPKGEEEAILDAQNAFAWPASLFNDSQYDLSTSVTYDQEKFDTAFNALPIFSEDYIVAPENARIEIRLSSYEIIDEVMGCTPIPETIEGYVSNCLTNQITELTLTDDCYVAPELLASSPQVVDAANLIAKYMSATIHYNIDNADENFTTERILSMIEIDPEMNITLNISPAEEFVQHLASTYNTYADVRNFVTTKGDTIKIGGGDYGWVIDKNGELQQIMSDLEGGQPISREPVYEQTAIQSGLDDIGNTYVEIDYTNQHLWYYRDGVLIKDTDIVSGNLSSKNGSVDGVFKIVYKQKDATLVGEDYNSKVAYFMPFAYNIGIHDASWRTDFGKNIYKTSGSHGCINIPPSVAKELFAEIEVGTPVIAYYREKVELTNDAARISNAYSYVEPKDDEKEKEN